jgi:glycine betaine/choline ABC-type transport system substrate-binding protein
MEITKDNNKKETINQIKSQCHSSSNINNLYILTLETILEESTTINTVADLAATGHSFFK